MGARVGSSLGQCDLTSLFADLTFMYATAGWQQTAARDCRSQDLCSAPGPHERASQSALDCSISCFDFSPYFRLKSTLCPLPSFSEVHFWRTCWKSTWSSVRLEEGSDI